MSFVSTFELFSCDLSDPGFSAPFPFQTAEELLALSQSEGLSIAELMFRNECSLRKSSEVQLGLLNLWDGMQKSLQRGIESEELGVTLRTIEGKIATNPIFVMEWIGLCVLAAGEIIPAILHYCQKFIPFFQDEDVMTFLLTAAAIGTLHYGPSSMAAAGLAALFGCTPARILHAAEMATSFDSNAMGAIQAINAAFLARRVC